MTEQELNSEIELLRSRDLLGQAVSDCKLDRADDASFAVAMGPTIGIHAAAATTAPPPGSLQQAVLREQAVRRLERELRVVPLRDSNLIAAYYESPDPEVSACVLNALAQRYVDKHLAVHRPAGAFDFFKTETERYVVELGRVERDLFDVSAVEGVATSDIEKEITIRKLGDLRSSVLEKKAAAAELQVRIRVLAEQMATLADRHTTEIRTRENPRLADLSPR